MREAAGLRRAWGRCQAAELLVEDEEEEEDVEVEDDDEESLFEAAVEDEVVDFAAGLLLDDEPRLSFR
ncbi:hypothetical protein GCM10020000_47260 [Streptomyces olivoverticillatus]